MACTVRPPIEGRGFGSRGRVPSLRLRSAPGGSRRGTVAMHSTQTSCARTSWKFRNGPTRRRSSGSRARHSARVCGANLITYRRIPASLSGRAGATPISGGGRGVRIGVDEEALGIRPETSQIPRVGTAPANLVPGKHDSAARGATAVGAAAAPLPTAPRSAMLAPRPGNGPPTPPVGWRIPPPPQSPRAGPPAPLEESCS